MNNEGICIFNTPSEMKEGLFGQVFLFVFEILPFLYERSIFPAWEIGSTLYGPEPDCVTIPGALDLAYEAPQKILQRIPLSQLRDRHSQVLGNDWDELGRIWKAYFRVPKRIVEQADALPALQHTLAVHYRGTDKQTVGWDSNPISQDDFLVLVQDLLAQRSDLTSIFAATDEFSFVAKLKQITQLPVLNLGEISFHKAGDTNPEIRADRALLDCLLISRCRVALETSSALPSFAKILNSSLDIYRASASKLFADIPYFPVAYIPPVPVASVAGRSIIERTMEGDWSTDSRARRFHKLFARRPRQPLKHAFYNVAERFGV